MLDIGENELLVLLFVVQANFKDREQISRDISAQHFEHFRVNTLPVLPHIVERRPRDEAAPGTRLGASPRSS